VDPAEEEESQPSSRKKVKKTLSAKSQASASTKKANGSVSKKKLPAATTSDDDDDTAASPMAVDDDANAKREVEGEVVPGSDDAPASPDASQLHTFEAGDKYKNMKNWEKIVHVVNTVERNDDDGDELDIFWVSVDDLRVRSRSEDFRKKAPQHLITFYESNLRWRAQAPNSPQPMDEAQ